MQNKLKSFIYVSFILYFSLINSKLFATPSTKSNYKTIIESETSNILEKIKLNANKEKVSQWPIGKIMVWSAKQLLNKSYVLALLDKSQPEYLYISLNATDCMLFVENVLALSHLIKNNKLTLNNFINLIKEERYHGDISYCNRNHYFKDWTLVNQKKSLVTDIAMLLTKTVLPYKAHSMSTWISANKSSFQYSSLNCIIERENFINKHHIGFIPLKSINKYLKYIQDGDIIGIVKYPEIGRADSVSHLGIAYINKKDKTLGMVHASSIHKKIITEPSLINYLTKFKDSQGIILLRSR